MKSIIEKIETQLKELNEIKENLGKTESDELNNLLND